LTMGSPRSLLVTVITAAIASSTVLISPGVRGLKMGGSEIETGGDG